MTEETRLELLRCDLQLMSSSYDAYLLTLLASATAAITGEGIVLDLGTVEDNHLVVMYAAYLYRKRAEDSPAMPRMLRWVLNNRLLAQKGAVQNAT